MSTNTVISNHVFVLNARCGLWRHLSKSVVNCLEHLIIVFSKRCHFSEGYILVCIDRQSFQLKNNEQNINDLEDATSLPICILCCLRFENVRRNKSLFIRIEYYNYYTSELAQLNKVYGKNSILVLFSIF